MLNILGNSQRTCGDWSRRSVLQAGGMGLLGLSLPKLLAAEEAQQASKIAKAKSVIFLFLFGGPSQLETFDMKPEAPEKIRGPFKPIASRTPGLQICEHLPRLAGVSDKFGVVRTMTHTYNDHSGGGHYIQTGHPWHIPIGGGFNATEKDWPAMGSVVEYLDEQRGGREMPSYVYLPNRLGHLQTYSTRLDRPGQYAGWLGRGYDPLATDIQKRDAKDNPYFRDCTDEELDFRIKGLAEQDGITLDRLAGRQSLLEQFDQARAALDAGGAVSSYDRFQQRALSLVSSAKIREAVDIRREPASVRDRYGRHLFGQSTLMARRLIEAGTRFVTVAWDAPDGYSWDSHTSSNDVKNHLLPGLDRRCPRCWKTSTSAACWTRRWWSAWARWAARRRPTQRGAAATGASCSPPCWPAPASAAARCTAKPTRTPPTPSHRPTVPKTWPPQSTPPWASIPSRACATPAAAQCSSSKAAPCTSCSGELRRHARLTAQASSHWTAACPSRSSST